MNFFSVAIYVYTCIVSINMFSALLKSMHWKTNGLLYIYKEIVSIWFIFILKTLVNIAHWKSLSNVISEVANKKIFYLKFKLEILDLYVYSKIRANIWIQNSTVKYSWCIDLKLFHPKKKNG